jgi:hypothetical protein
MTSTHPGCGDYPLNARLDIIKTAIAQGRIGADYQVDAIEDESCWAGVLKCVSTPEIPCPHGRISCDLLKSAYIFDTSDEAKQWVCETLNTLQKDTQRTVRNELDEVLGRILMKLI